MAITSPAPQSRAYTARSTRNGTIWIFDTTGTAPDLQLLIKAGYRAQFLKNSSTLLALGEGGWQLWNARGDGREPLQHLRVGGQDLHLSPDEKLAAFNGESGKSLQIWNMTQDAETLRMFLVRPDDSPPGTRDQPSGWLAITPQGFYDASSDGEKRLRWRNGKEFRPIEKSRSRFYDPASVRAALEAAAQHTGQ